jgi:uncharacterized membrane protein
MTKTRMEAFSDGVIAILITIMVLDLKVPEGSSVVALRAVAPTFCAYLLSFVVLGIYWNNHHHMLHAADRVSGSALWANLHLLFWLSLIPFMTRWMGEHYLESLPTSCYGVVLICAACAYIILQAMLIRAQGAQSRLRRAVGSDVKGKLSIVLYAAAIALASVRPWIAQAIYALVALIWFVPDRRIERQMHEATAR